MVEIGSSESSGIDRIDQPNGLRSRLQRLLFGQFKGDAAASVNRVVKVYDRIGLSRQFYVTTVLAKRRA